MIKQPHILQVQEQEYYQQINPDTGEIIGEVKKVDVVIKEVPRTGFSITYLGTIVNLIDSIGNKKMQVVKYVLKHMDSNNILLQTVREIASGCGCSLQTVNDTLKLLTDSGIIARKTGVIMLSPKLVHKGNAKKERYLMAKFVEITHAEKDDAPNDIKKIDKMSVEEINQLVAAPSADEVPPITNVGNVEVVPNEIISADVISANG